MRTIMQTCCPDCGSVFKVATVTPRGKAITYDGRTKNARQWANDPQVTVSHTTILRRLAAGIPVKQALFQPSATRAAQ